MKLSLFAVLATGTRAEEPLNRRQIYQRYWQEQGSSWDHVMEPVDTRNSPEFEKNSSIVVWRRCQIGNGLVYKRKGGEIRHPTPVLVRCSPGYELRKGDQEEKYSRNNILCKAGQLHYYHGTKDYRLASDLQCVKLPPPEGPKWPGTANCPLPIDDIKYEIIDTFIKSGKYGFVYEVSVPAKLSRYTIAMEYPDREPSVNIQTWTLNYFGFYSQYVVFHPKAEQVEEDDHRKFVIVLEGLNNLDKPDFHLFNKVISDHRCFKGAEIGRNSNNGKWFVSTKKLASKSDVTTVSVDRASGWVWPQ